MQAAQYKSAYHPSAHGRRHNYTGSTAGYNLNLVPYGADFLTTGGTYLLGATAGSPGNVLKYQDPTKGAGTVLPSNFQRPLAGYGDQIVDVLGTYMLTYGGVPNLDEETVKNFIDTTGEFASYPYFRTLVGQLGWLGGVELPILPVITNHRRAPRAPQQAPVSSAATPKTRKRGHAAAKAKP